jgi:hypothetical protein
MLNGYPVPQSEPQERMVFIPFTLLPGGQLRIDQLSFRGMPHQHGKPWTSWKHTHDLLLMAAQMAQNKMLEEMQRESRIAVAQRLPGEAQ